MNYPKIAIVIPVFNRIKYTVECLASLKNISYPNFEIIIVDDGSTDGTSEVIKKNYPQAVLVKGDGNLWWSKSSNIGIMKAIEDSCEYVLFLNNDDEVEKDILNHLTRCALDNPNTIVASKVLDYHH